MPGRVAAGDVEGREQVAALRRPGRRRARRRRRVRSRRAWRLRTARRRCATSVENGSSSNAARRTGDRVSSSRVRCADEGRQAFGERQHRGRSVPAAGAGVAFGGRRRRRTALRGRGSVGTPSAATRRRARRCAAPSAGGHRLRSTPAARRPRRHACCGCVPAVRRWRSLVPVAAVRMRPSGYCMRSAQTSGDREVVGERGRTDC